MRGSALEQAIAHASDHYVKVDRGEVRKQHTPRSHSGLYVGGSTMDFRGWYRDEAGNRPPLVLECKETGAPRLDFGAKALKQEQLEALQDAHARKIQSWLVVDFTKEREVYRVDGARVVEFADAPWRSSLSLDWVRACGEVCKEQDRDSSKRCVWWLDGRDHTERVNAGISIVMEKARAGSFRAELYPASGLKGGAHATKFRELMARKPTRHASDIEWRRWQDEMSEINLDRDIAEAKRKRPLAKKKLRGWY